MRRHIPCILCLLATAALSGCSGVRFIIDAVPAVDELTETTVYGEPNGWRGAEKVAMIDVSGLIADAASPGVVAEGENPVGRFTESLAKAENDRHVAAVIVRINSPGGTVTASDVMYREVRAFRERSDKPVVVLMGGVAASGGYYLACAADRIIAHPTTITGSIGVIMQTFTFAEGMRKVGIRAEAITSGPNKAIASPFAPMTPEHRELLQGLVDEFYGNFVEIVRAARPTLSESDVAWVTDGRVVSGRRAAEIGLVDAVGDLRDAFSAARDLAGLERARLVKYHRPIEYVGSPYTRTPVAGGQINLVQLNVDAAPWPEGSAFYYLWDPTAW